ncbi:pantetheine-phosphate adenylyltransferase [Salinicola aestuarinus]|uniref:pantetheine-phosphate adenylyltransferase n=1 Tax=Salinicola aestuarinus TaxID=1949082 RepID=UPI000DA18B8B|nr:pantetheine-phosphate adenylyltransferase [Salinicola aestuarinus]
MHTVVYPGTFDPITNGHRDLIVRAGRLFERVVVAVAESPRKTPALGLDIRTSLAREVLADCDNVEVIGFDGLLTELLASLNARILLRGVRGVSDFEYELQLANMNRAQAPDVETLFLTPEVQNAYVSSTLIREISRLGGDVSQHVSPCVVDALRRRFMADDG